MSRCPKGLPICSADSHKESNITTDIKKDETFPEPKSEIRHRTRCVAAADWCQQRAASCFAPLRFRSLGTECLSLALMHHGAGTLREKCHDEDNRHSCEDTLTSDGVDARRPDHTLFNGVVPPALCARCKSNSVATGAGAGAGAPGKRKLIAMIWNEDGRTCRIRQLRKWKSIALPQEKWARDISSPESAFRCASGLTNPGES